MSIGVLTEAGGYADADTQLGKVKERLRQAREDRKRFEPVWQHNLAFAAGKHYVKWNRNSRKLAVPPELQGQDLYTADVMTEYRTTALGELSMGDDRPELLLVKDDQASEDYQTMLNRAVRWGWENEWHADQALEETRRMCIDVGVSAIRCRWNPNVGPVVGELPMMGGLPLHGSQAYDQVSAAVTSGQTVPFQQVQRGAIVWEPLSPFNILVPPGIPNELFFPWEAVIRPALLDDVQAQYGNQALGLKEDTDIASMLGLDTQSETGTSALGYGAFSDGKTARLRDHVWLTTYYERPTAGYPQGRTITFAGNDMKVMSVEDRLPYQGPDESYRAGIAYFHWWRVSGRFWSRGLVDVMKDIQRSFNLRRNQTHRIIARGMPAVFVQTGSKAVERKGEIAEVIEIDPNEKAPQPFQGFGPGDWMWRDVDAMRADLEHATGLRGPRLGENPQNVTTYGQLAVLNDNEQVKRQPIIQQHQKAIGALVEDSVYDMATYWGKTRTVMLAGDEEHAKAEIFDAARIPPFYTVRIAPGAAKPRSQGAELKKVEDLAKFALESGAAMSGGSPQEWVEWYRASLEAGQVLDLPSARADDQTDKAELENHLMLLGRPMPVRYYDPHDLHIKIHRSAQIDADLSQNEPLVALIEQHIQQHVQMGAQQQAMALQAAADQQAALAPPAPMGPPAGPGAAPEGPPAPPPEPQGAPVQ